MSPNSFPIKKITSAQLQDHRVVGLCYNCDEKKIPRHKCTTHHFLLSLCEEFSSEYLINSSSYNTLDPDLDGPTDVHLSLLALSSFPSTHTFKFKGHIANLPITILIDIGSSHITTLTCPSSPTLHYPYYTIFSHGW